MKKVRKQKTFAETVRYYKPECNGMHRFNDGTRCNGCPKCGHKVNRNKTLITTI